MLGGLACHPPCPVWKLGDPKASRGHRPLPSELLPSAWPQQVALGAGLGPRCKGGGQGRGGWGAQRRQKTKG